MYQGTEPSLQFPIVVGKKQQLASYPHTFPQSHIKKIGGMYLLLLSRSTSYRHSQLFNWSHNVEKLGVTWL